MPSDLHVWVAFDLHAWTAVENAARLRCPTARCAEKGSAGWSR